MKTATISEAKNRLSALLDQVRAGESVVILDRGVPVASLEPITRTGDAAGRLRRLERAGVVSLGSGTPPLELLRRQAPVLPLGASAVRAVLEERGER
jgi:prevent-host-death family protein